ncbi:MAG: hypothetical protein PUD73_09175, partial [bacterium]|nr:hypothetical protein [bacterium]
MLRNPREGCIFAAYAVMQKSLFLTVRKSRLFFFACLCYNGDAKTEGVDTWSIFRNACADGASGVRQMPENRDEKQHREGEDRMAWETLCRQPHTVFLGEAGCGKSELAVHLALELAEQGREVHFFDLDQT